MKASFIYAFASVLSQIAGFLMLPVYTQYLTPEDYGIVGILILSGSLVELFFGAKFSEALPKYYFSTEDKKYRNSLISTAIITSAVVSSLSILIIYLVRDPASSLLLGLDNMGYIVSLYSLTILINVLHAYGIDFIRIQQRQYLYLAFAVLQLVLQISMNVYFIVYRGMGIEGLVLGNVIALSIITLLLLVYVTYYVGIRFNYSQFKQMFTFCWPLWFSGFAGLYIGSSGLYYLRAWATLTDAGLYGLANRFSSVLNLLVWIPFMMQWQVVRFERYGKDGANQLYQNVFILISTLLSIGALGLGVFSQPVIYIMADSAFHSAYVAVPFLAYAVCFSAMADYFNFSFLATNHTRKIGRYAYITAFALTLFYVILVPGFGFSGLAMSLLLAHLFRFVVTYIFSLKHYDMGINLSPPTGILLASMLTCYCLINFIDSGDLLLDSAIKFACFIAFCIGTLIYLTSIDSLRTYAEPLTPRSLKFIYKIAQSRR